MILLRMCAFIVCMCEYFLYSFRRDVNALWNLVCILNFYGLHEWIKKYGKYRLFFSRREKKRNKTVFFKEKLKKKQIFKKYFNKNIKKSKNLKKLKRNY